MHDTGPETAGAQVLIDHVGAVRVAARTTRSMAAAVGLPSPTPDRAAVVAPELASDVDEHAWDGAVHRQPFQLALPPPLLAAALFRDRRLPRDDATVLVARVPGVPA